MKAAVCREFGKPLLIEEIDIAEPGPGEIKVKLAACAICHSDIHYMEGAWGGDLPAVYGHEAAGIVETVGPGVAGLKRGDHVVVTLIRSCGHCHFCSQGLPVHCEASPIVHGLYTAAFAEYAVVDGSQAVAIPADLPLDCAALLACGVITGFGAVTNTANIPASANVVVIGTGGVGLNSIQAAAIRGARTVIAVDLSDAKLAAALRFGATHGVNPEREDARKTIKSLTGGRGADYAFVTVGAKAAIERAFSYLAKAGSLVIVGMPADDVTTAFEPTTFASAGRKVLGSKMGSARLPVDMPLLVALYQQGRLKLDELISGRFPLERINEAVAGVTRGEALRNVIVF
jgi:S-(hydroxymethyl)glutathione dehydrogenase/alcohol dehydrogenase